MSYPVKLTPKAHDDIVGIYNYVLKDGEVTARKQVKYIYDSLENLSDFPCIGKNLNGYLDIVTDYRFIVIHKVYLAFYRFTGEHVEVIRVLRKEQDYLKILGLN